MELHLVHKRLDHTTAEEEYGVVAIFFDLKAGGNFTNPFLAGLRIPVVHKKNKTISEDMT